MKRLITAALILLTSAPASALTLSDLQLEALSGRDTVQASKAQAELSVKQVQEAKSPFLPSASARYTANRLSKSTLQQTQKKNDSFTASLTMNLFSGFGDTHTLKAAKKLANAGSYNFSTTRQTVSHDVALSYLGVYRSHQTLTVSEDAARLYRDRYRQMKSKYDVGVLRKRDLLKVKVEMDNAIQDERKSRAAVRAAMNNLAFAVGRTLSADEIKGLDFSLFESVPKATDAAKGKEQLLSNSSALLSTRESLTASGLKRKAAKSAYLPRVDLTAAYDSLHMDDFTFASDSTNGDDLRLTATVSINLFDGMKRESKISQAALQESTLRFQLREQERRLTTEFENIILDRDVAEENLAVARSGLTEAEENLRVTDLAFEQGLATSTEVLDAIFGLSRARFNQITALTDLFSTHFALKRLTQGYTF